MTKYFLGKLYYTVEPQTLWKEEYRLILASTKVEAKDKLDSWANEYICILKKDFPGIKSKGAVILETL